LKKKPKPAAYGELRIPSPQEAGAAAKKIPPPEGRPEGITDLERPIMIHPPEELEIPLPAREFELPKLEFPNMPEEEPRGERRPIVAMPSLEELEAEVPGELPQLVEEKPVAKPEVRPVVAALRPAPIVTPAKPVALLPPVAPSYVKAAEVKPLMPVAPSAAKLAVPSVKPALKPLEDLEAPIVIHHDKGPLYINLSGYKSVILTMEDIRDCLRRANDHLDICNTIKAREDSALEAWHSSLENIQRKMIFIDRSLFERQEG